MQITPQQLLLILPGAQFGAGLISNVNTSGTGITIVEDGATTRVIGLNGTLIGRGSVDQNTTVLNVLIQF